MWLLNVKTRKLEFFLSERAVSGGYAILSHTWGEDEMTFDDMQPETLPEKRGYNKVELACRQALGDGYNYAWIDTICIDKRSSAELTEAINSMYRWYQQARICYVYLEDVELAVSEPCQQALSDDTRMVFRNSRWFTRSWTLQELIGPKNVQFYDRCWEYVGNKHSLRQIIHQTTRIDIDVLNDCGVLPLKSVAKRMSWAAMRSASRDEDISYSLLGLFDVSMPMLYGEGGYKAFRRLQEEIIRTTSTGDHSILAWISFDQTTGDFQKNSYTMRGRPEQAKGILSPSPYGFRHANNIVSWTSPQPEAFEISYHGLLARLLISDDTRHPDGLHGPRYCNVALNCRYETQPWTQVILWLDQRDIIDDLGEPDSGDLASSPKVYDRRHVQTSLKSLESIPFSEVTRYHKRSLTLAKEELRKTLSPFVHITFDIAIYYSLGSLPLEAWDPLHCILTLEETMKSNSDGPVRRAILIMDDYKGVLSENSGAAIEFTIKPSAGVGTEPHPHICAIPWDQYNRNPHTKRYGRYLAPSQPMILSIHNKPALQIESKVISVSGEIVWSFDISRPPESSRPSESSRPTKINHLPEISPSPTAEHVQQRSGLRTLFRRNARRTQDHVESRYQMR